jgi:hypothetical protein
LNRFGKKIYFTPAKAMSDSTYSIQARTTFMARSKGGPTMFRSLLEARWALTFHKLGFEWEYEPTQFDLPNGSKYTPDFYLDGIGWIEIKPTFDALCAVENKLGEFARWVVELVPNDTKAKVFSITAECPTFRPVCHGRSPVMEWSESGITCGNMAYGLREISTTSARAFQEEQPGVYEDQVERICTFTSQVYFDGPFTMSDAIFMAFQGWMDPSRQVAERKKYYLDS